MAGIIVIEDDALLLSLLVEWLRSEGYSVEAAREEWLAAHEPHPDDEPAREAALQAHLQGRRSRLEIEYRVRRPGGEWHWVHTRARCVRDSAGNPSRLVGFSVDISDRKCAEADKELLATGPLEAPKKEAVGTFTGDVAHDFNNILGAILGYGEMAQRAAPEGSKSRRYIDNMMHAGVRAQMLAERMLAFSRSGIGERAPVTVQAALEPGHALSRGNGQVIMVVDDEPALVALTEEMLAELGYEAVGFRSGEAALEAFSADPERFDLVLTDEMMPDLTGTGLALRVRQQRPGTPIAIMTGCSDDAVAALARSAGVSEILHKPLRMRDIAESLARILMPSSPTVGPNR